MADVPAVEEAVLWTIKTASEQFDEEWPTLGHIYRSLPMRLFNQWDLDHLSRILLSMNRKGLVQRRYDNVSGRPQGYALPADSPILVSA
jgi:hypothetical protein